MERGIVYKGKGKFAYCGWPSVGKLSNGNLIAVWSGDRLKHVCPMGKTVVAYSRDEGKTWTNPMPAVNTMFDDRDGGVCVRGEKVLITSFNNNYAFQRQDVRWHKSNEKFIPLIDEYTYLMADEADESDVGSSITVSEDGGWTYPTRYLVPITCPHGPIVLKDGRFCYVGTSFCCANKTEGREYNELEHNRIFVMFSDDGYNWTEPKILPKSDDDADITENCEPHVVELNNGELLVHIRVHKKEADAAFGRMHVYQTISSNGVTEWEKPYDIGVNGAPPHLMRHSSGAIVCVYGDRYRGEIGEMAIVSRDEGKSWSKPFVIDGTAENGDMGYPCSVELSDGRIFTLYYQHEKEGEKNYIKYTIWSLDEMK